MREKLVIATRGSQLALWQARHVAGRLEAAHPGLAVELLPIKTKGDKILDVPLAQVGGKGLFVKEIEEALLSGRADLAVHSMKDVPAEQPDGLVLGVIPEREDPVDLLLSVRYDTLADLPAGATVGTSSLRRRAQLLAVRPDLAIVDLRGNLDTRVRRLTEGRFDAIVVAAAGMRRLELSAPKVQRLAPPTYLPAAAQGGLGLEYRADDPETAAQVAFFEHASAVAGDAPGQRVGRKQKEQCSRCDTACAVRAGGDRFRTGHRERPAPPATPERCPPAADRPDAVPPRPPPATAPGRCPGCCDSIPGG